MNEQSPYWDFQANSLKENAELDRLPWRYAVTAIANGLVIGDIAKFRNLDTAQVFKEAMEKRYLTLEFRVEDGVPAFPFAESVKALFGETE